MSRRLVVPNCTPESGLGSPQKSSTCLLRFFYFIFFYFSFFYHPHLIGHIFTQQLVRSKARTNFNCMISSSSSWADKTTIYLRENRSDFQVRASPLTGAICAPLLLRKTACQLLDLTNLEPALSLIWMLPLYWSTNSNTPTDWAKTMIIMIMILAKPKIYHSLGKSRVTHHHHQAVSR